jgi:hypothetical protein
MPYGRIAIIVGAILGLCGIGWAIYAGIIRPTTKPNPMTHQEAETMYNPIYHYDYHPVIGFGCMRIPDIKTEKK